MAHQKSDLLVLAWIAWLVVSTLTHDFSWHGGVSLSTLVFYYLIPGATYVVVRTTAWNARRWKVLWVAFAVLGVYLGLTAVAEVKQLSWAVFPRYILSPEYPEFLGRGRGPLVNPVVNGLYLNAALLTCVVAAAGIKSRATRGLLGCRLHRAAGLLPHPDAQRMDGSGCQSAGDRFSPGTQSLATSRAHGLRGRGAGRRCHSVGSADIV